MNRHRFHLLAAWLSLTVGALGVAPLAKKVALEAGAAPIPVVLATALVSAVLVLAWLWPRGNLPELLRLPRRQAGAVLLVGVLGSGLVPLFAILAMTETTASNRVLFQAAYPAATAVAARFLLGERLRASTWLLIGLVCVGLAAVNLEDDPTLVLFGWPFWLLLATLPLIGIADCIAKRSLTDVSPDIVACGRAWGGVAILLLALPLTTPADWRALLDAWGWALLAGTCMAAFAIGLYRVFALTRASIAASLITLAPLLTVAGERVLLDVTLQPLQWLGFALVLGAVLLLSRRA
ncbi:MAG: DMT family transporter [Wenzhouxiangellaceae bacterium]|nr:DMT family transporter [Wenzhouxiangellaceae bacterium]